MNCNLLTKRPKTSKAVEIDWDTPATVGALVIIENGNNTFTSGGVTVTVNHHWFDANGDPEDSLYLRHQSDPNGRRDWPGNFAPNAALLWTERLGGLDGPIQVRFHKPVQCAGAQIQTREPGLEDKGKFVAMLKAYDVDHKPLGAFTCKCLSGANADDKAQFMGITGSGIASIEFSVDAAKYPNGFAINFLSVIP
ncbi:MAG: hypothetical protein HOP02_05545 [Methylococcaceae bacterium]|nr:hypothetical protein [Methylococcaceae bacterium]